MASNVLRRKRILLYGGPTEIWKTWGFRSLNVKYVSFGEGTTSTSKDLTNRKVYSVRYYDIDMYVTRPNQETAKV